MIVDDLRQDEIEEDLVERSARVRWDGGEHRLYLRAPHGLVSPPDDASAYLAVLMLLAMKRGEDLNVQGSVSSRLLTSTELIQSIYRQWDPCLHRVTVSAEEASATPAAGQAVAAFFSRGVDSTYTAIAERRGVPALTHLLFLDGLELNQEDSVRAQSLRLVREAAAAIALPLVVVESNIRHLTESLFDWGDMIGAGLAFVALSLRGLLARAVIPSGDTYVTLAPCGTHPLLDPLFSTEGIEIEHDRLDNGRTAKAMWIAEQRPDLLEYLRVCFAQNRSDNCGVCEKCLLTMVALQAASGLDRATGFPAQLDPEALRGLRFDQGWFTRRRDAEDACRALPPAGETGRTRRALLDALSDPGPLIDPHALEREKWETFPVHQIRRRLSLVRDGRPYPPLEGAEAPRRPPLALGLVRAVDPVANRHLYGVGAVPPGEVVEELGSLRAMPFPDSQPAWLSREGYLMNAEYRPPPARPSFREAARWALAPLSWRGFAPPRARARTVAWRLRRLLAGPSRPASMPKGEPIGHLHRKGGAGRLPLYSAVHPVIGDQLLAISPDRAHRLGYVEVALLGHLDAAAPVTGELGSGHTPALPWASRWGKRAP
jgi:hypothetical protein